MRARLAGFGDNPLPGAGGRCLGLAMSPTSRCFPTLSGVAQALLKVIKHCREAMPSMATGCLLGLNVGGVLEVANCFAFKRDDDGDSSSFQNTMMSCLKAVGIDGNMAGWYQSTPFATVCTKDLVATQYDFQREIPGSVVVIYDPTAAGTGSLALKALKLSDAFMKRFSTAAAAGSDAAGAPLLASGVFVEVPVRLHQNPVMAALLADVSAPRAASAAGAGASAAAEDAADRASDADAAMPLAGGVDCDLDRLELNAQAYLDKHLHLLSEQVEEMAELTVSAQVWERKEAILARQRSDFEAKRRVENAKRKEKRQAALPMRDPSLECFAPLPTAARVEKLDALLSAAQAGVYCKEMGHLAARNFGKLFLASALQAAE